MRKRLKKAPFLWRPYTEILGIYSVTELTHLTTDCVGANSLNLPAKLINKKISTKNHGYLLLTHTCSNKVLDYYIS
jgi:hypothetical protein